MAYVHLTCPGCKTELRIRALREAREHDITLCWACSNVCVLDRELKPRVLSDAELRALPVERRSLIEQAVQRTLARMRMRGRESAYVSN